VSGSLVPAPPVPTSAGLSTMAFLRALCLLPLAAAVEIHTWSLRDTANGFMNLMHLHSHSRSKSHAFLKNLDYTLKLRICNGYNGGEPFDVFLNEVNLHKGLKYTRCFESTDDLRTGDRINFKVKGLATGSFTIDQLPTEDAVLMLVIKRRDSNSMSTAFQSHVFANLESPQVAILDAYEGAAPSIVQLKNEEENKWSSVNFDSVVAIEEGSYQAQLKSDKKEYSFSAVPRECYSVIRVGMDHKSAPELIVYPTSGRVSEDDDSNDDSEKAYSVKAAPSMAVALALLAFA